MSAYARLVERLSLTSGYVAAGLIVASIVVICQMLVVRFVLGRSAIWQNEFVTFAVIDATFLGAPYVLLTRGHVNVDLVPYYLQGRARKAAALFAAGLGLLFCIVLFATSLGWWWEAFEGDFRTSSVWRARLWIPYLSLPVGTLLLILQYLVEIWRTATDRAKPFGIEDETSP